MTGSAEDESFQLCLTAEMGSAEVESFLNARTKMALKQGSIPSGAVAAAVVMGTPDLLRTLFQNPKDDDVLLLFESLHPYPQGSSGSEISIGDFKSFDSLQVTSFLSKQFCRPRQFELNLNKNLPRN